VRNAPTARCGNRPTVGRRPREAATIALLMTYPAEWPGTSPMPNVPSACSPPPVGVLMIPGSKSDIWGRKFCSSSGSAAAVRPGEAGQTGPGTSVEIHRPTRLVDETGD